MTIKEEFAAERASSRRWLAPALLVAAVVLAYANSLNVPFLFDDAPAVVNNATIRNLWSFAPFFPPADGSTTTGRPIVNFSFALNYAISGDRVWSYHAFNVVLHALATLTLFGLVRRTLRALNPQPPTLNPTTVAFAIVLVWSLHPLQTETVVGIAQRTELLCGFFYLLTLYGFIRATTSSEGQPAYSPRAWFTVSVTACFLGMATKEVMVTAPLIVLLYDRTFVARTFAAAWRTRCGYYLALAATWLLLGFLLLHSGGARGNSAGFGLGVSWWHYLLTQADALVWYLRLTVWPHPLVLDYGTAVASSLTEVWWQGLVIVALLCATIWALAKNSVLGFIGAWFFLILAPSSSVVPLVTQTIAEHRMYLPLATIVGLVALGLYRTLGSRAVPALVLVAIGFGGATIVRNRDFRSAIAIWEDNVAQRPHARSLTALGVALLQSGRTAESLPLFERALAADPSHLSAQRNRALALLQLGRATEAAVILATLPGREPGEAKSYYDLGNAFVREQKFAEAAAAYARTIALEPSHAGAHANLGNILLLQGRPADAIIEYETVLRLEPNNTRIRENLQIARGNSR